MDVPSVATSTFAEGRMWPADWLVAACAAVVAPMLLGFNLPPSATFLNQAVALVGWGGFLVLTSRSLPRLRVADLRSVLWLLAALAGLGFGAAGAWLGDGLPRPLALSALAVIVGAGLVAMVGAALSVAGHGGVAFRSICVALIVAGALSVVVGAVQVFAPEWADGNWITASAFEGRASGNLRQPNHLSSLLLWSCIAAVVLAETGRLHRIAAVALVAAMVLGLVMSASRTGVVGVALLAAWGVLDRRLSRCTRLLLLMLPLAYFVFWTGLSEWSRHSHQAFGGETRFRTEGDISSSRFAIWSDTLALIVRYPLLGVGFGEFNLAWSLTPFPSRPVAFFDHTHNLPLQFAVELGLPLALLILVLLTYALWRAFVVRRNAPASQATMLRAAFMIVVMMVVHSLLEYPLWYAYFLLPTAFVFGLCLGAERSGATKEHSVDSVPLAAKGGLTLSGRALAFASLLMLAGGVVAVIDYLRVAAIFSPNEGAPPLAERIAHGQRSWFLSHHAHYAAATTAEHPSDAMASFKVATHYLLDTRLMIAWAKALRETGDIERARHIAQRLREFRNDDSKPFFAPCDKPLQPGLERPFQCTPPTKQFDFRDFR